MKKIANFDDLNPAFILCPLQRVQFTQGVLFLSVFTVDRKRRLVKDDQNGYNETEVETMDEIVILLGIVNLIVLIVLWNQ